MAEHRHENAHITPNEGGLGAHLAQFRMSRARENIGQCIPSAAHFQDLAASGDAHDAAAIRRAFDQSAGIIRETLQSAKNLGMVNELTESKITQVLGSLRDESRQALQKVGEGVESLRNTKSDDMDLFYKEAGAKIQWLAAFFETVYRQTYGEEDTYKQQNRFRTSEMRPAP